MRLERNYKFPDGWKPVRNVPVSPDGNELGMSASAAMAAGLLFRLRDASRGEGELLNQPPVERVSVVHTGSSPEQTFTDTMVQTGLNQGFMSLAGEVLTLRTPDGKEDLVYKVLKTPGHYCCHCGQSIPDASAVISQGVTRGLRHVQSAHPGVQSPDPSNPAGYRRLAGYECVLDPSQHAKHRATPEQAAEDAALVRKAVRRG